MVDILRSKLTVPHFSDVIQRPRLNSFLLKNSLKPVTIITASAGYGKTTLISQAARLSGLQTVWIRLDRGDSDLLTFIHYLIAGFQNYFPDFGIETVNRLKTIGIIHQEWQNLLVQLINELEANVQQDSLVVLDDYHLINDDPLINKSLQFLLDNLPPKIHLIIISRNSPKLRLSKHRAMRHVMELMEQDLRFTRTEVDQALKQLFNVSMNDSDLEILHLKTDGWITGLVLLVHGFRFKKSSLEANLYLRNAKGLRGFIAEYLDENVYQIQSPETKEFLKRTSILDYITVNASNALLKIDNAREILQQLEADHLFTFSLDEKKEVYVYHHLFREFLESKCQQELKPSEIIHLQSEAGRIWEVAGEPGEALKHYLSAQQFQKSCELLNLICRNLLKAGRLKQLETYFEKIPEQYLDKQAWLLYTQARMHEFLGRPKDAIKSSEKALTAFEELKSDKGIGLCLTLLGYNHYQAGDFYSTEKLFTDLLEAHDDDPVLTIQICANLVFVSSHLGKMSFADAHYKKATRLLTQIRRPDLEAFLNLNRGFRLGKAGDFIRALAIGLEIKDTFVRMQAFHQIPFSYHLISWSLYYLGRYQEGLQNAKKGMKAAESKGFKDSAYAWLLMDASMNANALNDTESAVKWGLEGLSHFRSLENRWGQAYICQVLLMVYQAVGDYSKAEYYAQKGIEIADQVHLPMESGLLKLSLAAFLIRKNELDTVSDLLTVAEGSLKQSTLFSQNVNLSWAHYYWKTGKLKEAEKRVSASITQSEQYRFESSLDSEKDWIIPAFISIYPTHSAQSYIVELIRRWETHALTELARIGKGDTIKWRHVALEILMELKKGTPPSLSVFLLGPFSVKRGNSLIVSETWSSNKAKTIFQYLVVSRSRGFVGKEVLMELLWPEASPKKAAHRLQVALSSLRKILEPENPANTPSSYLLRKDDSYRLEIGEHGWVDCEQFEEALHKAKTAPSEREYRYLMQAESLYRGEFLQEELYSDWCLRKKDSYRLSCLQVLKRLIDFFESQDNIDRCILVAEKFLLVDPHDESVYQDLMRYYAGLNRIDDLCSIYEKCEMNLKKGLDMEPNPETRQLYLELTRASQSNT